MTFNIDIERQLMSRRIHVKSGQFVSCQVRFMSFHVKSDLCQAAPVLCRVKSAPCPCSAGRVLSDRRVSLCPCHVGATLLILCSKSTCLCCCVQLLSQVNIAAAGGRLIGSLDYILVVLSRGTGPRGEKMAGRSSGTDSQEPATILDPLRVIFADVGPDRLSAT